MRSLLIFVLFCLAAQAASAQRQPPNSSPTKTSIAPATAAPRQAQTSSKPAANRSTTTQTTNRSSATTPRGGSAYPAPDTHPTTTPASKTADAARTTATTPSTNKSAAAQPNATAPTAAKPITVRWMTIEEALERSKTEKRKLFIDVYTEWCGWCKRMDETTFSDPRVAAYLNEHYYPVKFDAEQQKDIVFRGKTYQFKKVGNRGYHELAAEWLNNRLSYPTTVFLNEDLEVIQPLPGYLDAPKFETVITYFGTDSHKRTPWETYEKNFASNRNR